MSSTASEPISLSDFLLGVAQRIGLAQAVHAILAALAEKGEQAEGCINGSHGKINRRWWDHVAQTDWQASTIWFDHKLLREAKPLRAESVTLGSEAQERIWKRALTGGKAKGRPKNSGIDDTSALERIGEMLDANQRLGVKSACESLAAEQKIPEQQRSATVARWRRKWRDRSVMNNK
jgi:hypothetical protein